MQPKFFPFVLNSLQVRPIIAGIFTYVFAAAIPNYLGQAFNWVSFTGGLVFLLLLMSGGMILSAFYATYFVRRNKPAATYDLANLEPATLERFRTMFLTLALGLLTIATFLLVALISSHNFEPAAALMVLIAAVTALLSVLPVFRISRSGFSNIVETFFVAVVIPAVAYFLQTNEHHRLLGLLSFPIVLFYFAMLIALSLKTYPEDDKQYGKQFIQVIGWQNGMTLHNLAILIGYLWIGASFMLKIPGVLIWPALLTLPFGLLQVFHFTRITQGAKPQWRLIQLLSYAIFGLTTYMITLSLWIN